MSISTEVARLKSAKTNIATAIKAKGGTINDSDLISVYAEKLNAIPSQNAQTFVPTTSDQTISAGKFITGTQTIKGDANLTADNIAKDITIFGITGTHEGGADVQYGYVTNSDGVIKFHNLSDNTDTTVSKLYITDTGVAEPDYSTSIDVSDTTAIESDVISGKYFYKADGTKVQGSIQSVSAQTFTPGTSDQYIESGKYLSGVQTIKGDSNLTATNIAKDVVIFGITGTHEGGISVSDTTTTTSDVLVGKYFYNASGQKVEGTIPTVLQPSPSLSLSYATGVVTATHESVSGYVSQGATTTDTLQIPVQDAQTITPTTTDQTIASGKLLTGTQTIKGDSNLTAGNIANGVTIFNVTGTHEGGTAVKAGYITISDGVVTVHNITDSTTSTANKIYIPNTGVSEPAYAASTTSMNFYKCASVDTSTSTWTGYLATIDSETGKWSFAETATTGLTYTNPIPEVDSVYADETCICKASDFNVGIPTAGLIFHHPLDEARTTDITGKTVSYTGYVTYSTYLGIPSVYLVGSNGTGPGGVHSPALFTTDTAPFTYSVWCASLNRGGYGGSADSLGFFNGSGTHRYPCTGFAVNPSYYIPYKTGGSWGSSTSITQDSYHNYVMTYDGAILKAYVDGTQVNSFSTSTPRIYSDTSYDYAGIEAYSGQSYGYYAGLRVYNRALTAEEVIALAGEFTPTNA